MIPPGEHIAETKICRLSGKEFVATNKDLEHIEKVSPTYNKKKFLIPSPDLCPAERQRNRLCFRNERCFYHRKCSFSRQPIVSIYSPDKPDLVYEQKIWWSDEWSPFDYGVDFDFDRPFFDQFADLLVRVPKLAMINAKSENATYTNYSTENKDCYQSVGIGWSENVYHSYRVLRCEHIFDCYDMFESRDCYECLESKGLMFCYWCKDCHSSSDLLLCYDCQNCDHCIGCTNLR